MPDIASDSIDAARIAAVAAAVGRQRLHELMLILAERVQSLAAAAETFPESAEACLAALHQSRGSAASLGFLALAEGFGRMEVLGRQAEAGECDFEAVRQAGRALPGLWKDAMRAKEVLLS
jgi:hypothetical protein